ncbi:MAG: D-2-hydroxyacid dehydrogenase [Ginsengibacter sp.]
MIIYVDAPLKKVQKDMLRCRVPDDDFIFKEELPGKDEQLGALLNADILLGNPKPVEWLQKAVNLKWVQLYSTGFEYYNSVKIPAIITNVRDYYTQPCSETIIAGIMALYRKINTFSLLKDRKQWVGQKIRSELHLLYNKQVIILGTGNIGRQIAKILKGGFDAEIIFFGRTARDAKLRSPDELLQHISWADIIIGCLPGTNETKGLFTKEMIDGMKPTALFCNVGRGNLVKDEDVLTDALMNHKIGGAVLDVTAFEPIPPESNLWNCPNTILTQHSGGGQETEYDGILELFIENLGNFKNGKPLKNQVNFSRAY